MFPVHDWQFWVATAVALGAAFWVVRGLLGVVFEGRGKRRRGRSRRATLTVEGRPADAARKDCH